VILAGGRGERFWPLSQPDFPKQFLSIFDDKPLLIQTLQRIASHFKRNERLLIIPGELKKLTVKYVGRENIILEPLRRNTAPAICLAAMRLHKRFGPGVMHVMPADHIIRPKSAFINALMYGQKLAQEGRLVTYGIKPTRPETGYGYIRLGGKLGSHHKNVAYEGARFTEKPRASTAKRYVQSKRYLWNSGIFTFSIETILGEIRNLAPKVYYGVKRFVELGKVGCFRRVPDISIDYGVMEKSDRLCVIKGNFGWDDVGSWLALERYFTKDRKGNILIGDAHGIKINDSLLYSEHLPLRAYDVEGLVVVVSRSGVLVCKKTRAQELKKLFK
jgi:mannose-1-phosphate guanylyltransferase